MHFGGIYDDAIVGKAYDRNFLSMILRNRILRRFPKGVSVRCFGKSSSFIICFGNQFRNGGRPTISTKGNESQIR